MNILAFETSCDDTSIAVFINDKLIAMETKSQIEIHNLTGGVVPEIAAREHAESIFDVLNDVLIKASLKIEDIDYIGVTYSPGLLPSLLTGTTVASTISKVLNIPIIPINHIEAHIFSNYIERKEKDIEYPLVCMTVSGGHNDIYLMYDMWTLKKLGSTIDDASGEAFDKSAKMMGLSYPGGPVISKLASEYEKKIGKSIGLFPRVWLKKKEYNFSFSGLKTSIKNEIDNRIKKNGNLTKNDKLELSFEIENAIIEVLAYKLINAALEFNVKTVMLSGGVSANEKLKSEIKRLSDINKLNFIYPKKNIYSMDNAAMVGINAYYKIKYFRNNFKPGIIKI